ncbi:MAG TPA: efflux RND transporter periplasmic adaptor subunit [Saprospiraceae bacterium]|nr:efflux RND transporter periplasmic adaptor subunit [Saprospiraceae bacterium]
MKKYSIASLALVFAILISPLLFNACSGSTASGDKKEEAGHGEEGHDENENTTTVSLNKEQMKAIGLELGSVEQKNLTSTLKANGYLRVPNQNKANATTLYGGVVKTLLVQPGSVLKAGQTVATISNPQIIPMQVEYLTLASRITLAELEYNRQMELNSGNAGALKNLQQAESELSTLRTRRASLRQQLQLMGITPEKLTSDNLVTSLSVRSPLNGTVSNIMVNIGSYLDVNTAVAEIVDNSQLHLDLFVYEQDLPRLRKNQLIHFTLTNNPGKEYDAVIYSIGNAFEKDTKTIPVHAQVKGDKTGLIEGMGITAVVSLGKATVPAVPTDAIVTHEGQDFIFIEIDAHREEEHHDEAETSHQHEEGDAHEHTKKEEAGHGDHTEPGPVFEKIAVRRGTTDVGYAEITSLTTLPPNAKVVVKGAFFLLAKMNNKGEGHAH